MTEKGTRTTALSNAEAQLNLVLGLLGPEAGGGGANTQQLLAADKQATSSQAAALLEQAQNLIGGAETTNTSTLSTLEADLNDELFQPTEPTAVGGPVTHEPEADQLGIQNVQAQLNLVLGLLGPEAGGGATNTQQLLAADKQATSSQAAALLEQAQDLIGGAETTATSALSTLEADLDSELFGTEATAAPEIQSSVLSELEADLDRELFGDLESTPPATATTETAESILNRITTEQVKEQTKKLLDSMKNVPWQTMALTMAKPLAKVALGMIIKQEAKGAAAVALSKVLGAGVMVTPGAAALVAAGADTVRLIKGGSEAMYKSAAQHTAAALTTGIGREHTGSESQREFEKNRIEKKRSIPLKLLRKVGAAMNAFRSASTQVAMGVTRDRATISDLLGTIKIDSADQLRTKVLEAYTQKKVSKYDIFDLGSRLARLRAMGSYGDIDVYGAEGSSAHKVDKKYTPELMKQFHEVLNDLIQKGELSGITQEDKDRWEKEYRDISRKTKDKTRKLFAIAGSAAATFVTVGAVHAIPWLVQKIEDFDFDKWKAEHFAPIKQELDELFGAQDSVETQIPEVSTEGELHGIERGVIDRPEPEDTTEPELPELDDDSVEIIEEPVEEAPEEVEIAPEETPETVEPETDADNVETEAPAVPEETPVPEEPEIASPDETTPGVEDAVELRDLGDDQVPWDAIMNSILRNPRVEVENLNGTTNIIKNLYRALNANNEMGVIGLDSSFAVPHTLGGDLPEGAVGWFFSEDQIENLAPQVDEAIQAFNKGEELTEIQQVLVNLNSSGTVVARTIQELNDDPELFQQILDIANEG
ncbi:MAG: hypothetical protein BroJett025_09720 [Patescibacteria group bacterium]|nr:MAG: hypothetical protein BroJett025_09720 [Patescibacteria group bacterium]